MMHFSCETHLAIPERSNGTLHKLTFTTNKNTHTSTGFSQNQFN
jgi:hypothetical protein